MHWAPDSNGARLREAKDREVSEYNHCHKPAGPAGGQFDTGDDCSHTGALKQRVSRIAPEKRLKYAADRADRVTDYMLDHPKKKPVGGGFGFDTRAATPGAIDDEGDDFGATPRPQKAAPAKRNDGGFGISGTGRFNLDQYDDAAHLARTQADATGKDYAIRKMRNGVIGKDQFVVSRASWNDSDYNKYEIVKPSKGGGNSVADKHIDNLSSDLPDARQMKHQTAMARQNPFKQAVRYEDSSEYAVPPGSSTAHKALHPPDYPTGHAKSLSRAQGGHDGVSLEWTPSPRNPYVIRDTDGRALARTNSEQEAQRWLRDPKAIKRFRRNAYK